MFGESRKRKKKENRKLSVSTTVFVKHNNWGLEGTQSAKLYLHRRCFFSVILNPTLEAIFLMLVGIAFHFLGPIDFRDFKP